MARQQYRVTGELAWQSNSGNALLAIANQLGSGKKLTLRSFEVVPVTSTTTGTAGTVSAAAATYLDLARATVAGGETLAPVAADSNASWPSTVGVLKRATVASPEPLGRVAILKQTNQASLSWLGRQNPRRMGLARPHPRKDSDLERIVVRAGEGLALYASTLNNTVPLRVSAVLIRHGTPNRSFALTYFTAARGLGEAVFAIANASGSGETVSLRDLAVEEVGTFDSPYLQLVPVGGLIESSASAPLALTKLDTAYPDPSAIIEVRADCPMFPYGQYENAFADSSTGSPKGFSYLKTKDFLGPIYRALFPEVVASRPGAMPDCWSPGHRFHDLFIRNGGGIVLREGEGVALVSAAETAAGATAAVGVSGWSLFDFAATVDMEQAQIPVISLTGMVVGSRWRIERVSDSSEVGSGVTGDGSAAVVYDAEDTPLDLRLKVRKASSAPYYKPYQVEFELTSAGISIPVSQVADP